MHVESGLSRPAAGSPFQAFDIAIPAGDLIGMIIAEEKAI